MIKVIVIVVHGVMVVVEVCCVVGTRVVKKMKVRMLWWWTMEKVVDGGGRGCGIIENIVTILIHVMVGCGKGNIIIFKSNNQCVSFNGLRTSTARFGNQRDRDQPCQKIKIRLKMQIEANHRDQDCNLLYL